MIPDFTATELGDTRTGEKELPPAPRTFEELYDEVMSAFEKEQIEPVPVKWSYRAGIAVVSVVMIALPILYAALIGVVGWATWYHALNHTGMISAASSSSSGRNSGRAAVFAFFVYLAPILAGITMILFMLKPFFSKPASDSGRRSLKPEDEPLLFEFVDRICTAVRAPLPRRIDIDTNINASAGFGRGVLSMFGNDLVLTIGMPLVSGLDMRQFAGVLAHEFGHFAQGAGMRVTYLIRSISYWLTRVVYERDSWDERLENWSSGVDLRIGWVFYFTRLAVWLTRKILWLLMMAGHAVSGLLLRQMEFDADRHEARLAGSRTFATTARQLAMLNVSYQGAMTDLKMFYDEGRLGDNLPRLIMLNCAELPEKIITLIDEMSAKSKTGWLDTHPADSERIASANLEQSDGIFRLTRPASELFRRFDYQSRAVTWDYYKEIFGKDLKKEDIHPVDELVARQKKQQDAWKALRRFFQGHCAWYRPLPEPDVARNAAKDIGEASSLMKQSRDTMLRMFVTYADAWKKYDEADTQLIEIQLAQTLLTAGLKVRRDDFSIPMTSAKDAAQARQDTESRQSQLEPKLTPFEDAASDRLYFALQLARLPKVLQRVVAGQYTVAEIDELLDMFSHINERLWQLIQIRDGQITLGRLLMLLSKDTDNAKLVEQTKKQMAELYECITALRDSFATLLYPFDHARADLTMAEYLLKELPDAEHPGSIYEAADAIGHALPPLHARVLGRLCQIAEAVETVFGLPALADPPEEDEPEEEED